MRRAATIAGAVLLGGALWFGFVYGCITEFAKAVGDDG